MKNNKKLIFILITIFLMSSTPFIYISKADSNKVNVTDSGVTGGVTSATSTGFSIIMQLTAGAGQSVFTFNASAEL